MCWDVMASSSGRSEQAPDHTEHTTYSQFTLVSPQQCELALSLVREFFGDAVAKVARTVVYHAQPTLASIIQDSKLQAKVVKHCMIILIKHNFVNTYLNEHINARKKSTHSSSMQQSALGSSSALASSLSPSLNRKRNRGGGWNKSFIYVADPAYMLALLKFPKWLIRIQKELGKEAEFVVESIFEHGRLDQKSATLLSAGKLEKVSGRNEMEVKCREAFERLVKEQFVERAPSGRMLPPWFNTLDSNVKRGHKGLKQDFGDTTNAQLRANDMYKKTKNKRFKVDARASANGIEIEEDHPPPSCNGVSAGGRKKGNVKMEVDTERTLGNGIGNGYGNGLVDGKQDKDAVMWRLNPLEFNHRYKEELFTKLILHELDQKSGQVFRGIMSAYRKRRHELVRKFEENSQPAELLSVHDIRKGLEGIPNLEVDRNNASQVGSILDNLSNHPLLEIIQKVPEADSQYRLNMEELTKLVQSSRIEAAVEQKFGSVAKRIFRLLTKQKSLEEKDIADKAMILLKDARKILYTLFRANYLHIYEVPKDPSHTPSRTYFLWHIDMGLLLHRCREDVYESLLKIHNRCSKEVQRATDLVGVQQKTKKMTASEQTDYKVCQKIVPYLEGSLMDLDDLSSIFAF